MRAAVVVLVSMLGCAPSEVPTDARPGRDAGPPDAGADASCASGACECMGDGDCTSPAPCIDAVCILGGCQLRAYDDRCAGGEYCDRRFGCTTLPDAGMPDAPSFDAPFDAWRFTPDTNLRPVGGHCLVDRECAPIAGLAPACINAPGELAPGAPAPAGGYCSRRCGTFDLAACGDGAVCVETDAVARMGWCMRRCEASAECESGQSCGLPPFSTTPTRVCLP